jgi:hypothetical protein
MVCTRLAIATSGPAQRGRRKASSVNGRQSASASAKAAAHSSTCCIRDRPLPAHQILNARGLATRHVDQRGHFRACGAAQEFGRRSVGDKATVRKHENAVGGQKRLLHVMRDHDRRQAQRIVQRATGAHQAVARDGV